MYMFGLAELFQTLFTQFATTTAEFETAKRRGIVVRQGIIDPEGTCLHFLKEPFGFQGIVGIEVRT